MALLGATKRMPSADATSPLPQTWAIGSAFCAATMRALAAAMVSGRMKFWLTQDSRVRLSAGWSVRIIGSKPMLQACAISAPHRLVVNSSTRAWRSLTWVKASAKPERAATSSMMSGRSTRGMRAEMAGLQGDEAGRPLDLVERAQHQLVTAAAALDPSGRVARQVGGDLAPGTVQPGGEIADLRLGIRRPVERAADGQTRGVPGFATQQAAPGVGVAHAGGDEHVAPLQPGPESFEGCEDVGTAVGDAAGVIEDVALPGRADETRSERRPCGLWSSRPRRAGSSAPR